MYREIHVMAGDRKAQLKYRLSHREELRIRRRFHHYGIGQEDFQRLLAAQGHQCAICRCDLVVFTGVNGPNVDHDHADGSIRGLLCGDCNVGLGRFHDNPQILTAAAAYLANPPAPTVLRLSGKQLVAVFALIE
jgi:hypothetical protein